MARRVASEAGARYYGIPIGHIITPDREDEATARNGRPAPPGSATGTDKKRAGQNSEPENRKTNGTKKVSEGAKSPRVNQMQKPTISGPVPVLAGKRKFSAPEGSTVYKSPAHPGRVYVVTQAGEAHVFTSQGELKLEPGERKALAAQVKAKFQETPQEEPQEEETGTVTWVKLVSLVRRIAQADAVGDDSEVERLILKFRDDANKFDPDTDPRALRTRIKKATGA